MSRSLAFMGLLLSVSGSVVVSAAEPVAVIVERCTWLETGELLRLTRLELGSIVGEPQELQVSYTCTGNDVTIGIGNMKTGVRVERAITGACCEDAEAARTLALLSVGLYRAAKGLLTDATTAEKGATVVLPAAPADPSDAPRPAEEAGTTALTEGRLPEEMPPTQAARPATEPSDPPPPSSGPPASIASGPNRASPLPDGQAGALDFRHQLGIVGRTRVHNLGGGVVTNGVGLEYRAWPWRRFALGASFGASFGSAERIGGEVDTNLLSLGGLAAWRFANWSSLSITGGLGGGATMVTVQGDAKAEEIGAGSASGATAHARLLLAPSYRTGFLELSLPFEFGFLFRAPRGEVVGDKAVQLDGVFAGAGLAVSFGWSSLFASSSRLQAQGGMP